MNAVAWILTILLTLAFLGTGLAKLSQPKDRLRERMAWVDHFSAGQVKGIGALETLGALGLILPAVTKIAAFLSPLAAIGLALTMAGALLTHIRIKDPFALAVPSLVLGLLALVLAILRFGPAPL